MVRHDQRLRRRKKVGDLQIGCVIRTPCSSREAINKRMLNLTQFDGAGSCSRGIITEDKAIKLCEYAKQKSGVSGRSALIALVHAQAQEYNSTTDSHTKVRPSVYGPSATLLPPTLRPSHVAHTVHDAPHSPPRVRVCGACGGGVCGVCGAPGCETGSRPRPPSAHSPTVVVAHTVHAASSAARRAALTPACACVRHVRRRCPWGLGCCRM